MDMKFDNEAFYAFCFEQFRKEQKAERGFVFNWDKSPKEFLPAIPSHEIARYAAMYITEKWWPEQKQEIIMDIMREILHRSVSEISP